MKSVVYGLFVVKEVNLGKIPEKRVGGNPRRRFTPTRRSQLPFQPQDDAISVAKAFRLSDMPRPPQRVRMAQADV